jgi:threonine dehydrogenase-like Zn-dependent dehydrogenase
METVLPIVRKHGDELARMITHRLRLDEGPEAYALFAAKRRRLHQVVLTP